MKPDSGKIGRGILIFIVCSLVVSTIYFEFGLHDFLFSLPKDKRLLIQIFSNVFIMSLIATAGFYISRRKGYEPRKWIFYCFFFHVAALIYLLSLPDRE